MERLHYKREIKKKRLFSLFKKDIHDMTNYNTLEKQPAIMYNVKKRNL